MIRTNLLIVLALLCAVGCNKDPEALAALTALDETAEGIVQRVTDATDKKAGVLAARKFLDERTVELSGKMNALANLKDFEISDDVRQQMATRLGNAAASVAQLPITYARERVEDPEFDKAVIDLVEAFEKAALPWGD